MTRTIYLGIVLILFGLAVILWHAGMAHAFTTAEDLESGQWAEAQPQPRTVDGVDTNCLGSAFDDTGMNCQTRLHYSDPTACPKGQSLITLWEYGYKKHVCAND